MKYSMVMGIVAGSLAIIIGLLIVIPTSVGIYNNEHFDFDKDYWEAIENDTHPTHPEEIGWQTFFLKFLRFLGFEVLAAGAFGLTGGLVHKRKTMARRFMTAGAVFGFLSLVGLVAGILLAVAVSRLNRGD